MRDGMCTFGSDEAGSAALGVEVGVGVDEGGEAEVGELEGGEVAFGLVEDVLGLEVSVHDVLLVHVGEGGEEVPHDLNA